MQTDLTPRGCPGAAGAGKHPKDTRTGWRLHHSPGAGVPAQLPRPAEQKPLQPLDIEEELGLLPHLARRDLPAGGTSLSTRLGTTLCKAQWRCCQLGGGNTCPGSVSPTLWGQNPSSARDSVPEAQAAVQLHGWKREQMESAGVHLFTPWGFIHRKPSV